MAFYQWLLILSYYFIFHLRLSEGHGSMVLPINWIDKKVWMKTPEGYKYDYYGIKSGKTCKPGCELKRTDLCPGVKDGCPYHLPCPGSSCYWYTNYTFVKTPTLFDHRLRTYSYVENPEAVSHTPWRAPGFAKTFSACGVAGGNPFGCSGNGCSHPQGGYSYGIRLEDMNFKHKVHVTNWTRGDIVEAAWGILANHGGGYSYRLCKLPKGGFPALTEECFQKTPLKFVGGIQWAQYGEDPSTRKAIPAVRVNKGTYPENSEWTRNPIPACRGNEGGGKTASRKCLTGYQFPPIDPDLCGFGEDTKNNLPPFQWSLVDKIQIPKNIEPGEYVFSWRWDAEQFGQVWKSCASVYLD